MEMSQDVKELAGALAKAQGQISGAAKDKTNPHFRSSYADLSSVWEACRKPLSENGLAVSQTLSTDEAGRVVVTTLLLHTSGQWLRDAVALRPMKEDPQAFGSAATYGRRYALAAMVGVAPEDDDGNAASQPHAETTARVLAAPPAGYQDWRNDIAAVAEEGTEALQKAWKESKAEYRHFMSTVQANQLDALKKIAAGKKGA